MSNEAETIEQTAAELREGQGHARRIFLDQSSPSARSVVRVLTIATLLLLLVGVIGYALYSLTYLLFLVVLSIFFAYLLDPLIKAIREPFKRAKIERFMPRSLAIGISYLIVFLVLFFTISAIAPQVADQAKDFGNNLPAYREALRQRFGDWEQRYNRMHIPDDIQGKITERLTSLGDEVGSAIGAFLLALIGYLPWFVLVPVLAFFFLRDVTTFRMSVLRMFPVGDLRWRVDSILGDINNTLAAYVRAQLISCFVIGLICTAGFYIIGIKYALLFGIVAGFFEFVPLIGPLSIGVIVTLVAAFSDDPWKALYVAIFLIVLRIVQDYVLYPRIIRGGIHLHPVAIILSVLAGEQIAGIPGVFLSIPIVAILTVIYKHAVEHSGHRSLLHGWLEPEKVRTEEAQ